MLKLFLLPSGKHVALCKRVPPPAAADGLACSVGHKKTPVSISVSHFHYQVKHRKALPNNSNDLCESASYASLKFCT